jgi:Zn-finger domain-containing protein
MATMKAKKKEPTETITLRIDMGLKEKLRKTYGRKLSVKLIPYLKKIV